MTPGPSAAGQRDGRALWTGSDHLASDDWPLHRLSSVSQLDGWLAHLADYEVASLFTQFTRPVFRLPEESRSDTVCRLALVHERPVFGHDLPGAIEQLTSVAMQAQPASFQQQQRRPIGAAALAVCLRLGELLEQAAGRCFLKACPGRGTMRSGPIRRPETSDTSTVRSLAARGVARSRNQARPPTGRTEPSGTAAGGRNG